MVAGHAAAALRRAVVMVAIVHVIITIPRAPRDVLQLLQEHTLSWPHSRVTHSGWSP